MTIQRRVRMDWTVIIPTRGRPTKLAACVRALSRQTAAPEFELLVAVDGPDQGEGLVVEELAGNVPATVLVSDEPAGPAAARNRAFAEARGRWTLLLNDDVVPEADLLARHVEARAEGAVGDDDLVLGSAPFRVEKPDRLFDRLVRETSMVFFYDQMDNADPARDWGWRHAWTLNLSVRTDAVNEVGAFSTALPGAAFEDVELGWRLRERFGASGGGRVLYRPAARVEHDHRYEPAGYLGRERMLGRDAWALADANAACAHELFGRDIRSADEVAYSRAFVEREARTAALIESGFLSLGGIPADAVGSKLVPILYQQHLLVKRWWWRVGLLEGSGEAVGAARDRRFGAR
ncbi:MAG: glycosyltransferase [Planctomycetota bacterium]